MQLQLSEDLRATLLYRTAADVAQRLARAGYPAFFAGGFVRDTLAARPCGDIDIATAATPPTVARLFPHTIPVGEHFGVMIVVEGGMQFEVATFRADIGVADGRHPAAVAFCDAREDALRRDFTINGMFFDPLTGELLDWVGGQEDLAAGIIRTIGDPALRFSEDYLRILRAVRFAARFGYAIEPATLAAMSDLGAGLERISAERIFAELNKMLSGPAPATAIRLLDEAGLLARILPDVAALKGCEQPPEYHPEGDVFVHTLLMLAGLSNADPVLAWSVLLHDVGKPATQVFADRIRFNNHDMVGAEMTRSILTRLKCPGAFIDDVVACVENHMRFMAVPKMRLSTLKRFLGRPTIRTEIELHRADCGSSHGDTSNCGIVETHLEHFAEEALRPVPLIGGRDLIALGLSPGPLFGRILDAVYDMQLEEQLFTKEEALAWVQEHLGEYEGEPRQRRE